MSEGSPCKPYPDGASYKTIAVTCDVCGSWECWVGYLAWESRICPDYARVMGRMATTTERLRKLVTTWTKMEPNAELTALLVELLQRREREE